VFEVAGRERLAVPAGEFDALRLVRRDDDGRSMQIWLDATRSYLPLRVLVVHKDGTRVDQVATRFAPPR
jgi:negative regulator of sigma E activity